MNDWLRLRQRIERQVQLQDVDARLTQQPASAVFRRLGDQLLHSLQRQAAHARHSRRLIFCCCRADVRIQTAARGGEQIQRDRRRIVWVSLTQFREPRLGRRPQRRMIRAEIRAARSRRVVREIGRGREPPPELARRAERLPNQRGAARLPGAFQHTAVGLPGEHPLCDSRHQ